MSHDDLFNAFDRLRATLAKIERVAPNRAAEFRTEAADQINAITKQLQDKLDAP